jgi:hypothetical protein
MRHERHYTLEEARALRGRVAELVDTIRAAREGLTDEQARAALAAASQSNGGGAPGRIVGESFVALRACVLELQEREIVLRDLDRGLVDFPTIRADGTEAYLCWLAGDEEDITTWHGLDDGFDGRQDL